MTRAHVGNTRDRQLPVRARAPEGHPLLSLAAKDLADSARPDASAKVRVAAGSLRTMRGHRRPGRIALVTHQILRDAARPSAALRLVFVNVQPVI